MNVCINYRREKTKKYSAIKKQLLLFCITNNKLKKFCINMYYKNEKKLILKLLRVIILMI